MTTTKRLLDELQASIERLKGLIEVAPLPPDSTLLLVAFETELREQIAREIEGLLIGFVDGGTYNEGIIAAVQIARGE